MEFLSEILHLLLQAKVLVGAHALFLVSPPKTESVTKYASEGRSAGDWAGAQGGSQATGLPSASRESSMYVSWNI